MSPLVRIGQAIAAVGSVVLLISLFLNWIEFDGEGESYWDLLKYGDKVMVGIAVASLALTVLSVFFVPRVLLVLSLILGGFALGVAVPLETFDYVETGQYVAIAGAAAIAVGTLLALLPGLVADEARPANLPATAAIGQTPAGWFPDPSGQARLRYWDGSRWTDQTQA